MKKFFTAALLALAAFNAYAANIEVGVGYATIQDHGDGTWYQASFQNTRKTHAPVFSIGLTSPISQHVSWHVAAVDLGSYTVDSWDSPVDADYSAYLHGSGHHLPLVHLIGGGHVYGVTATLEAHTHGFGVEAGPFLYHATWGMTIPNWKSATGNEGNPQWETCDNGQGLVSEQSHWKLGAVVGIAYHAGPWTFAVKRYWDGAGFSGHGSDPWPPLWKYQTVGMVSYTF